MVPDINERIIVKTKIEGVVHYGVYAGFVTTVGHVMLSDGGAVVYFTEWKYPQDENWRTV